MTDSNRNIAIDILKIIALFSVVSVHAFYNSGYYAEHIIGMRMLFLTIVRSFFMICVPLFLLITGYLMTDKKLERGYYRKLIRIIVVYIFVSLLCIAFRLAKGDELSFIECLSMVLDYSASQYAWYIEMYLGLYLMVPFLNRCYHGLNNRKEKRILIYTCLILTSLPGVINIYRFDDLGWWLYPSSSTEYMQLIPAWFMRLYPLTYYFIGNYVREYGVTLCKKLIPVLFVITLILLGTFSFYRSNGAVFIWGEWCDWGSLLIVAMSYLFFCMMICVIPSSTKNAVMDQLISRIAKSSMGAFMISWIIDYVVYYVLSNRVDSFGNKCKWFFITIPIVFCCSVMGAIVIEWLCDKIISKASCYGPEEQHF